MAQINGVVVGVVVDVRDPLQQRRVSVRLASINSESTVWARVAAGFGRSWVAPDVDDEVVVVFENGDARLPVVIGGFWNGADAPPESRPRSVHLPTGGVLHAIDATGQPTPRESAASLLQQTAPWLASMDCTLRLLRLMRPLIDIVAGLPSPRPAALQDFQRAAADLSPCLLATTAASALPFVRDLLCVVVRALQCVLDEPTPKPVSTEAIGSIQTILDSAAPFFTLAGIQPVRLSAVATLQDLPADIARVQAIADGLGGCAGTRENVGPS